MSSRSKRSRMTLRLHATSSVYFSPDSSDGSCVFHLSSFFFFHPLHQNACFKFTAAQQLLNSLCSFFPFSFTFCYTLENIFNFQMIFREIFIPCSTEAFRKNSISENITFYKTLQPLTKHVTENTSFMLVISQSLCC